jgi:hypothetical protein
MGQRFTKFMSTIMLLSTLIGFTSCVDNVDIQVPKNEIVDIKYSDVYSSEKQIQAIVKSLGADNSMVTSYNA